MSKKLLTIVSIICIAFLIFLSTASEVSAQNRENSKRQKQIPKIELNAKKGRGKIDKNLGKFSIGKPRKSRGLSESVCRLEIANQTQFRVNVYVNERYRETLTAMKGSKIIENAGRIKIYSRTDRDPKNRFNYWGPGFYTCGSDSSDGAIFLVINNRNL